MLVRYSYSYSRSALLVSRCALAVTKAPWHSVSVLYHAGAVLVYVAGAGVGLSGDYRLPARSSSKPIHPIVDYPFPCAKHILTVCLTNSNLLSTLRARSAFDYLHRDLITAATRR